MIPASPSRVIHSMKQGHVTSGLHLSLSMVCTHQPSFLACHVSLQQIQAVESVASSSGSCHIRATSFIVKYELCVKPLSQPVMCLCSKCRQWNLWPRAVGGGLPGLRHPPRWLGPHRPHGRKKLPCRYALLPACAAATLHSLKHFGVPWFCMLDSATRHIMGLAFPKAASLGAGSFDNIINSLLCRLHT